MLRFCFTALIAGMLLCAAGTAFAAKNIVVKISSYHATSHPVIQACEYFKKNLEQESGGAFEVQIYPNSQLGAEERTIEMVQRGIIQIGISGSLIKKDEPTLSLIDSPFVIETWKQAYTCLNGPILKKIVGNYPQKTGVDVFGVMVNGFRVISSSKPIKTMEDFKHVKLRLPNSEIYVKMFQAFGTNSVMMPMSEVYNALETKVVDGQENPYPTVKSTGWWEAQRFMLETHHMFSGNPILVNQKFLSTLKPEQKAMFDKCLKAAIDFNWKISEEEDNASRQFLIDKGLEVTVPTAEFRQQMKDKLKGFFDWYYEQIPATRAIIAEMESVEK